MDDVRVILDLPAPDSPVRLRFSAPHGVIEAPALADVLPALRAAERAARDGAWVVGFIAFDAAAAFDRAFKTRPHLGPAPLAWFGIFDEPHVLPGGIAPIVGSAPRALPLAWESDTSRIEYDRAIALIRDAIANGDVYQVNHTLRFGARCDIDAAGLYDDLVAARHGVYHALIETGDWAVVSASPELFFDLRDRTITTRPMKGTMSRGRWLEEDRAAVAALYASAKDRAENLMIVDLLRNDLGRIARFGSVHVDSMFDIETYPTVHQMTSTISAQLRDDVGIGDVFAALFPCGSVTGAPKIAAMQHIAMLEHSPRGPYCGAIGVIRPDGSATFNVAIRTLVLDRVAHTATYGAGGGITWDSFASAEYDEAVAKAAILRTDTPDFDLLETMRLDDGIVRRHAQHLDRIGTSAQYWGYTYDVMAAADAAIDRVCGDAPHGAWRLRLTASRDAVIRIERDALGPAVDQPDSAGAVQRVALAHMPVHSRDRMLQHKTTARDVYDAHRDMHPDAFDVLLYNERGHITEFTIGNIVCEIDGRLMTPQRDDGLLAGTFRAQLLAERAIEERSITLDELDRVTRMWLINSVREWVAVRLHEERAEPAERTLPFQVIGQI